MSAAVTPCPGPSPRARAPGRCLARIFRAGVLALAGLAAPPVAGAADVGHVRVLETPGFVVRIETACEEGSISCDRVTYRGQSKRTRKALRLTGRTAHTTCADGVTPCRFLGYVFANGDTRYFVSEAGELLVRRGDAVLVREAGQWK